MGLDNAGGVASAEDLAQMSSAIVEKACMRVRWASAPHGRPTTPLAAPAPPA